ncbi:UDP-N-acetylglucosamine transporter-like isoform X2 [Pomacea canaliculata]|uniref:UDP-N-acetylglucosamine transporter-like isoform X2 n=1 Tax=Pomacea canaliculata TaxID=400727 RepID=UPI000D73F288|nr:UDP-N-acetylglucosamine transporter-like isoform X2 [Pomacea canaliculata]
MVADSGHAYRYGNVSHTALVLSRPPPLDVSMATGDASSYDYLRKEGAKAAPSSTLRWGGAGFHSASVAPFVVERLKLLLVLLKSSVHRLVYMDKHKSLSLGALVLQTSLLALTIRYSRVQHVGGSRYLSSTAVVMSEAIKLLASLYMFFATSRRSSVLMWEELLDAREAVKVAIPSGIYTFQNNLQFIAVSHLDATTFQVTYQLKILTTAIFSILFLRRLLDATHWLALLLLTVGVILVQLPRDDVNCRLEEGMRCDVKDLGHREGMSATVGLVAVFAMCVSSGFAGVYFEKILKTSVQSLWAKNVQMAFFSVVLGVAAIWIFDSSTVSENGLFQGYNIITVIIILQQAAVGLIVSLVIKYADNILKGFASSVSIILTMIISHLFLHDLVITSSFLVGTATVICSVVLYHVDRKHAKRKLATVI